MVIRHFPIVKSMIYKYTHIVYLIKLSIQRKIQRNMNNNVITYDCTRHISLS